MSHDHEPRRLRSHDSAALAEAIAQGRGRALEARCRIEELDADQALAVGGALRPSLPSTDPNDRGTHSGVVPIPPIKPSL